ncbi:MAG: hypothetical protein WBC90_10620, partial [Albidovulum sp.]
MSVTMRLVAGSLAGEAGWGKEVVMKEVAAFVLDGSGGAEAIDAVGRDLAGLAVGVGFVWVNVDFASKAGLGWLMAAGLD